MFGSILRRRRNSSPRRRKAIANPVAAQILEERVVLSALAIELTPQFEQLRQQLGDQSFAEWLENNRQQTGDLQGVGESVIDGFDNETRRQFDEIESTLNQWLEQFRNPCPLGDFDMDGEVLPLTDGILALRFLAGFRGESLTLDAVNPFGVATDVENQLFKLLDDLDVDGDGESKSLTDGVMFIRHLAGFDPIVVTSGALVVGGSRPNSYQVVDYIEGALIDPRPAQVIEIVDEHASDAAKQKVTDAEKTVTDRKADVVQADRDKATLQQIHDDAQGQVDDAQKKQQDLQAEADELKQRIGELEQLEDFDGGGPNILNGNEMWVVLVNLENVYVGKVEQGERGEWQFVAADGHVQVFDTNEQADAFAKARGEDEYNRIKEAAETAQEQLPGLRQNLETVEGELKAAQDSETNAVKDAKAAALDGRSDEEKQRIEAKTDGSTTPADLDGDIQDQDKVIDDAKASVVAADKAVADAERAAVQNAADNLDKLIQEKDAALSAKREDIARQTILLELAGSMLKQLQIQTSFDAAAFAAAVGRLGDKAGQLPLNVGTAANIVIKSGGALLGGVIKIQGWLTQSTLTGHPDRLRDHVNGSGEMSDWLQDRGFENGEITEEDAKKIQLYVDHLMGTKTSAQDHLNEWDKCLDQAAKELADLKNKQAVMKDV